MISEWISRVGSAIPRGFSRQYILTILKEEPMTGKEIMDKAAVQSEGRWKPSPGLIYPLLGRLLEEGLIADVGEGKYKITQKGIELTSDLDSFKDIIQKQFDVMMRVGNLGKFMAMDVLDKIVAMGSVLSSNQDVMTKEEREKYRQFLVNELRKMEDQDSPSSNTKEKVGVQ